MIGSVKTFEKMFLQNFKKVRDDLFTAELYVLGYSESVYEQVNV